MIRSRFGSTFFRLAAASALLLGLLTPSADAQTGIGLLLDRPTKEVRAIDFTAATPEGGEVSLADYKGKAVLLNFWATWCIPCRVEMPAMERLHQRMAGKAFVMLAVSEGDTAEQIRAYAKKYKLTFRMLLDEDGAIGITYRAQQLPMTYLIDPQGMIVGRAIGPREWDSDESVAYFEALISGAGDDGDDGDGDGDGDGEDATSLARSGGS